MFFHPGNDADVGKTKRAPRPAEMEPTVLRLDFDDCVCGPAVAGLVPGLEDWAAIPELATSKIHKDTRELLPCACIASTLFYDRPTIDWFRRLTNRLGNALRRSSTFLLPIRKMAAASICSSWWKADKGIS